MQQLDKFELMRQKYKDEKQALQDQLDAIWLCLEEQNKTIQELYEIVKIQGLALALMRCN